MSSDRRHFLKTTGTAALGMALLPSFTFSANETVNLAVIGCNGMGWSNMLSHLKMEHIRCIALCDVDDSVLTRRTEEYKQHRSNTITTYKDYRKLLENKDVDAVIIGTPDHWHCRMLVDALEAGKHIYVEKPLANSIQESFLMEAAAKRFPKQIIQVGQWQRSGPHYQQAVEVVRSGMLGKIRLVKVWSYQGWMKPTPVKPDGSVPDGVDYAMWLGPAPTRPFNPNRFHFTFRWFWDYAGGLMTDWGVHEIDIALHAMQATAPKSVLASGGKFAYPEDASETPDTMQAVYEYDGFTMLWEHALGIDGGNYGKTEGIAFIGNNATLVVNRGGLELIPEVENKDGQRVFRTPDMPDQYTRGSHLDLHTQNFIAAIKNNSPDKLNCPIREGHIAAINAHMGNIALKTGRKIYWDTAQKAFKNDDEANQLMRIEYKNGWKLPEG